MIRINFLTRNLKSEITLFVLTTLLLITEITWAADYTYVWAHPSPQGNIVYNMVFENENHGWAVTGCGIVLETNNNGNSWEISYEHEECIDFFDIMMSENGTLIISGNGIILRSTNGGVDWQIQEFPNAGMLLDLAEIPGGGFSAVGENGVMLVSQDDGQTWADLGPGGEGYARHHVWKTAEEAFVVGYDLFEHTVDGGENWQSIDIWEPFGFNEIFFLDDQTGYVIEDFSYYKTTDGGNTWAETPLNFGPLYRYRTLEMSENHWFAVSFLEGGEFWETTDAGQTWNQILLYESVGFPFIYKNGDRIFFGSDVGDIFYTDDGGQNINNGIENLAESSLAPVNIIGERPDGTLFSNNMPNTGPDNNTFLRSDDGGLNWYEPENTPGLHWIFDIEFANDQYGILGAYENIRYTTDGGDTWLESSWPADYNLVNFSILSENLYFAGSYTIVGNGGGNVYKSTDKGASWSLVSGGLPVGSLQVTLICFVDEATGFVAGIQNNQLRIYKTTDSGESWEMLNFSGLPDPIIDMVWFNENEGLTIIPTFLENQGIYKTMDGGISWEKVSEVGVEFFSKIHNNRVAAFNRGNPYFQETIDNGETWEQIVPPMSSVFTINYGIEYVHISEAGYILGAKGNRIMLVVDETSTSVIDNGEVSNESDTEVWMYPNPATQYLNFHAEENIRSISIFNSSGKLLAQKSVNQKYWQQSIIGFAPGIYVFRIITSTDTVVKKVIVKEKM
jgi:photosystem II stability/assembly factor-like uncharacterized protein